MVVAGAQTEPAAKVAPVALAQFLAVAAVVVATLVAEVAVLT
jgi:hypothetical protein